MSLKIKIFFYLCFSLNLSILFFYPLIATLDENIITLQWQVRNTYELIFAIFLLVIIFSLIIFFSEFYLKQRIRLLIYFFISIVPAISFFVHFLAQLGYKEVMISIGQYANLNFTLILVLSLCVIMSVVVTGMRYPAFFLNIITASVIIISPLSMLSALTIWKSIDINVVTRVNKESDQPLSMINLDGAMNRNVIILLFDEMSYDYLYNERKIIDSYPNLKYLSSISSNYHAAKAPGDSTINSLPGLLGGRRFESVVMSDNSVYHNHNGMGVHEAINTGSDNIFAVAQDIGLKTFMFGTYLPYCMLYNEFLNECKSFSIYNYGAVETNFSILNPFLTTFILWPRQYPQGFLKNFAVSQWQKNLTEQTILLVDNALNDSRPFFLFTHFYFTHIPLVFGKDGYYKNEELFLQNSNNYSRSLNYADSVIGNIIMQLKSTNKFDDSLIVILSDHNHRIFFPERKSAIPLIIKGIGQKHRLDIEKSVNAESILRSEMEKR